MKFGPLPLDEALGKILGHNVTGPDGRRVFRKGKALESEDVETLRALGRKTVYVAELEAGDVDENVAASRIAQELCDDNFRLSGPSTGRVNIYTLEQGLVRVDVNRLYQINQCDGVTLATLRHNSAVVPGKVAGTLKVLPYALPVPTVRSAAQIAARGGPLQRLRRRSHLRFLFADSLNAAPAENFGTVAAAILIFSPVRGFWPTRAARLVA